MGMVSPARAVGASVLRDRVGRAVGRCHGDNSPDQLKWFVDFRNPAVAALAPSTSL